MDFHLITDIAKVVTRVLASAASLKKIFYFRGEDFEQAEEEATKKKLSSEAQQEYFENIIQQNKYIEDSNIKIAPDNYLEGNVGPLIGKIGKRVVKYATLNLLSEDTLENKVKPFIESVGKKVVNNVVFTPNFMLMLSLVVAIFTIIFCPFGPIIGAIGASICLGCAGYSFYKEVYKYRQLNQAREMRAILNEMETIKKELLVIKEKNPKLFEEIAKDTLLEATTSDKITPNLTDIAGTVAKKKLPWIGYVMASSIATLSPVAIFCATLMLIFGYSDAVKTEKEYERKLHELVNANWHTAQKLGLPIENRLGKLGTNSPDKDKKVEEANSQDKDKKVEDTNSKGKDKKVEDITYYGKDLKVKDINNPKSLAFLRDHLTNLRQHASALKEMESDIVNYKESSAIEIEKLKNKLNNNMAQIPTVIPVAPKNSWRQDMETVFSKGFNWREYNRLYTPSLNHKKYGEAYSAETYQNALSDERSKLRPHSPEPTTIAPKYSKPFSLEPTEQAVKEKIHNKRISSNSGNNVDSIVETSHRNAKGRIQVIFNEPSKARPLSSEPTVTTQHSIAPSLKSSKQMEEDSRNKGKYYNSRQNANSPSPRSAKESVSKASSISSTEIHNEDKTNHQKGKDFSKNVSHHKDSFSVHPDNMFEKNKKTEKVQKPVTKEELKRALESLSQTNKPKPHHSHKHHTATSKKFPVQPGGITAR